MNYLNLWEKVSLIEAGLRTIQSVLTGTPQGLCGRLLIADTLYRKHKRKIKIKREKIIMKNYISERLYEKLETTGLFNEDLISMEKMVEANRHYIDIATDGSSISYVTAERFDRFDGDFWNEELRKKYAMKTRPGRVMQAIYGKELSYDIQRKLRFMLFDGSDYEVKVVQGKEIAKYYNVDMYDERRGELGGSCMRACPSSFFQIYTKYAKMAVVMRKTTGKITARSIIFEDCKSAAGHDDKTMMSRIYACDDIFYDMLMHWGLEQGYYIFKGGYSACHLITAPDTTMRVDDYKPFFITEKYVPSEFGYLPFIDNFGCAFRNINGDFCGITPDTNYIDGIYADDCMHSTSGDGGYSYDDYCHDCDEVCADCWEYVHQEWNDDDPCDDCYGDCSDCIHG